MAKSNPFQQTWKCVDASTSVMQAENKIRVIMDQTSTLKPDTNKSVISLVAGDPAKYGNLSPPQAIKESFENIDILNNKQVNKYPSHSIGLPSTRKAILSKYINYIPTLNMNDITVTCGCTQAISLSICSLLNTNSNDNILIPCPGWPVYKTMCIKNNFKYKQYNCLENRNWEIDCNELETLIDENTKAILINNPSNPCGTILSEQNVFNILKVANKHKLVIISDEIYSLLIYPNCKYISFSAVKNKYSKYKNVPVLICSGTAKSHLIPGWKFGWIIMDDRSENKFILSQIRMAIQKIQSIGFGPPSIIQTMIPHILHNTHNDYFRKFSNKMYKHSSLFCEYINENISQLNVVNIPQAAFYVFIKINIDQLDDSINNDIHFFEKLLSEQSLIVVPGSGFGMDNYFRTVICAPTHVLQEAARRLKAFCDKHSIRNATVHQSKL